MESYYQLIQGLKTTINDILLTGNARYSRLRCKGRLAYEIGNGLTVGANLSYDDSFDTRFSGDFKYNFGKKADKKKEWQSPVIQALTESVKNRDVRVHDATYPKGFPRFN